MLDRVRKTIERMLRSEGDRSLRGRGAPPPPPEMGEFVSTEARLRISQHGDELRFQPDFASEPLVRLPGRLAEAPTLFRSQAGPQPSVRIHLSVFSNEGPRQSLELTVVTSRLPAEARPAIVRSSRRRLPPDEQVIEIVYAGVGAEARYLLRGPLGLAPIDFHEVSQQQTVFEEIPPVSHMIAFLKATLHHRRATLRSLTSMARWIDQESVRQVVQAMNTSLSPSQDFTNSPMRALRRLFDAHGLTVNPSTVAAVCLVADIHLGRVGLEELRRLTDEEKPIATSGAAALACAAFFGASASEDEWRAQWTEEDEDPPAADAVEVEEARSFLEGHVRRRTALTILADLADESGSERSRTRVQRLVARVPPEQVLSNDEHEALQDLLAHHGKRVHLETLAALGVYVDFEAGLLSEEDIDSISPRRAFVDTSLYAMTAVAAAFDVETRVFGIPERDPDRLWSGLEQVVTASGGAVARFIENGQPGHLTLFLPDVAEVRACRERSLTYIGDVMCALPVLDHLTEADLDTFEAVNPRVVGCFVTDEKRVQWRPADSVRKLQARLVSEGASAGRFTYIDRYDVWQFHHKALAERSPVKAEDLVGRQGVVLVYLDPRGNPVYRRFGKVLSVDCLHAVERTDCTFAGEVVTFVDAGSLTALTEPSQEYLLGLPDDRTVMHERLDRVYGIMEARLHATPSVVAAASRPHLRQALEETLASPALRTLLLGLVEHDSREAAVAMLLGTAGTAACGIWDELHLASPLAEALTIEPLREAATLLVLWEVLFARTVPAPHREDRLPDHAEFDLAEETVTRQRVFVELLADRILHAVDTQDTPTRALAATFLGYPVFSRSQETRLAVSYVLARLLDDTAVEVARAAGLALATIALRQAVPPTRPLQEAPPPGERPPLHVEDADALRALLPDMAGEVSSLFGISADQHRRVMNMLGALLSPLLD